MFACRTCIQITSAEPLSSQGPLLVLTKTVFQTYQRGKLKDLIFSRNFFRRDLRGRLVQTSAGPSSIPLSQDADLFGDGLPQGWWPCRRWSSIQIICLSELTCRGAWICCLYTSRCVSCRLIQDSKEEYMYWCGLAAVKLAVGYQGAIVMILAEMEQISWRN